MHDIAKNEDRKASGEELGWERRQVGVGLGGENLNDGQLVLPAHFKVLDVLQ